MCTALNTSWGFCAPPGICFLAISLNCLSNFEKEKKSILEMGGSIDMEWKWCNFMQCWTFYVTLSCDLAFGLSRPNFEIAVPQKWDGKLSSNERDVIQLILGPTMWPWPLTSPMTQNLDFQGAICMVFTESMHCNKPNITYLLRYGRVNWHETKGIRVRNNAGPFKQPLTLTSSMTWISKSNLRISPVASLM